MKEYTYSFQHDNYYLSSLKKTESFGNEANVKLIIAPHEYEIKISDEVLKSSSCRGYIIEISSKGAASYFDNDGLLICKSEETQNDFREFGVEWKQGILILRFGHTETVDNYPNCDGEYDRWDTRWVAEYEIKIDTTTNLLV